MPEHDKDILVPAALLVEAITSLTAGADALLDRDWDCYSSAERLDAEGFVERHFRRLARDLEQLLAQDV